MKKIAMILTIASAIWWALFWLVVSTAIVFLLSVPNTGSIINLTTTWQMVAVVLPIGPLGLLLLWAAYRSLKGTIALIGVALATVLLSFVANYSTV